jgi:rRNA maturation protein Nop10
MKKQILHCDVCGKFTMNSICCEKNTTSLKPLKFSLDEKYADYRRKAKYPQTAEENSHQN